MDAAVVAAVLASAAAKAAVAATITTVKLSFHFRSYHFSSGRVKLHLKRNESVSRLAGCSRRRLLYVPWRLAHEHILQTWLIYVLPKG